MDASHRDTNVLFCACTTGRQMALGWFEHLRAAGPWRGQVAPSPPMRSILWPSRRCGVGIDITGEFPSPGPKRPFASPMWLSRWAVATRPFYPGSATRIGARRSGRPRYRRGRPIWDEIGARTRAARGLEVLDGDRGGYGASAFEPDQSAGGRRPRSGTHPRRRTTTAERIARSGGDRSPARQRTIALPIGSLVTRPERNGVLPALVAARLASP
jgi:hypothetical protein